MKTLIIYCSIHHNNTEKIVNYILEKTDVEAINILDNKDNIALFEYDNLVFASGIYYGNMDSRIYKFIEENKEHVSGKKIFTMITSGLMSVKYEDTINKELDVRDLVSSGFYQCRGYDTYGPWKLIGGLSKGHPNEDDMENALNFIKNI
ncbi:flavodoxin domain-containing protein [Peptostreptococcus faecalis]|uniref:flavodoxin domain-containing protein n=1 Tax=Peptostreptococcus faecalis TaxID=2045015 RepID=UPI000C7C6E0C|nr:flavodoxin domain-containing protein [Peptostreptococcus faecalis]